MPTQAARNKHTGEKVAIKHIDRVFADKADTVRIIRELRFLRLLKHPNIIGVVDVLLPQQRTTFDDIYIVFELLDTNQDGRMDSEEFARACREGGVVQKVKEQSHAPALRL